VPSSSPGAQPSITPTETTASLESARPRPTLSIEELTKGSSEVTFRAADGVELAGRIFGRGHLGIVLSHMGEPENNQADWFSFARSLAAQDYLVLTYDRRGVCPGGLAGCSKGNNVLADGWKDVLGAAAFLRSRGVSKVVAMGASIGAMASLRAAEEPDSGIDGVVWIAGVLSNSGYQFHEAEVAALSVPTLVISASGDPIGAFVDAGILDRWLTAPKRLFLPDSHLHGTDMLGSGADHATADAILQAVVDYLKDFD
jgi:pimeloyl-ACP methyl ester carboxylesterase